MRRYYREMDGSMDPADDGEWVRWEDAEAEVARLREETARADRRAQGFAADLATERAAHDATKAASIKERRERDEMWHRRQENWRESSDRCLKAAEARVAELEREVVALQHAWERRIEFVRVQHATTIDQARVILNGRFTYGQMVLRLRDLLRAHPATATPAATGVERCDLCGMKTPHDAERPLHHIGCGVGAPEKEQGT